MRYMTMKIRILISLFFLFCINGNASDTEYRIESKFLSAVIDDSIFNKPIKLSIIKKLNFKSFRIYNSYKNEYIQAESVKVMYQTPFDAQRKTFSGGEIGTLIGIKSNLKNIKNGDIVFITSIISIANIKYEVLFSYLIREQNKELFFMASELSQLEVIK